jgi:predicted component of viral defense system (DUF524 family)
MRFDPDISIAIRAGSITHWLNFDAKYRLEKLLFDPSDAGEIEGVEAQGIPAQDTFKKDDLNKMHCYRDAILGTRGAYIIFPGSGEEGLLPPFVRRPRVPRRGLDFPSVGAFRLKPGGQRNLQEALKEFIRGSIQLLASNTGYIEETGLSN